MDKPMAKGFRYPGPPRSSQWDQLTAVASSEEPVSAAIPSPSSASHDVLHAPHCSSNEVLNAPTWDVGLLATIGKCPLFFWMQSDLQKCSQKPGSRKADFKCREKKLTSDLTVIWETEKSERWPGEK